MKGAPLVALAHISHETRTLARTLMHEARAGGLEGRYTWLVAMSKQQPHRMADVLLVLAATVAQHDPLPDQGDRTEWLKRMHAEHARCKRLKVDPPAEVLRGEREYQRTKKRRYRLEQEGEAA